MLAKVLAKQNLEAPVVLALPRGGVAVAMEVARALKAPLDIVLVRKIGVPSQPELAAAAVVNGGAAEVVTNSDVVELAGISREYIDAAVKRELEEIDRRRRVYLQGRDMNACTQGVSEEHVALPRPYPRLAWISTDRD